MPNKAQQRQSLAYALLSGLSFAISNCLNSSLSAKYGVRVLSLHSLSALASWSLFYATNSKNLDFGLHIYYKHQQNDIE